jgi:hypothetical protein
VTEHPPVSGKSPENLESSSRRLLRAGSYTHHIKNHLTIILGSCELALTPGASSVAIAGQLAHIRASALSIAELTKALEPLQN